MGEFCQANIVVHQFKAPRFFIPCEKARLTLHLSYHGEYHYNSVRAIGDEGNGPALPITLQTPKRGSRSAGVMIKKITPRHNMPIFSVCSAQVFFSYVQSRGMPLIDLAGSSSPWPDREAEVARSCPWASPPNIVHALEATAGRGEDAIELLIATRNEPALAGIASADKEEGAAKPSTPYDGRACDTETNGLPNGGASSKGVEGSEEGKGLVNGNGKSGKAIKAPKVRKKVPRAATCPCGSGVKYKNCCRKKDAAVARGQLPVPKPGSATSSPDDSRITDDLGALVI